PPARADWSWKRGSITWPSAPRCQPCRCGSDRTCACPWTSKRLTRWPVSPAALRDGDAFRAGSAQPEADNAPLAFPPTPWRLGEPQGRVIVGDKTGKIAAPNLDAVVNEVVAEAHLRPEELRPEERAYLKEHALKKPLRVFDIWALGVGGVIAGVYFGWNLGLKDNGPVAMLVASLIVCLLYLTWVLALAELSVAMPFAGGPLAYGRRAADPSLGFVMGWSMFLECQFAAIAAAQASGGYIAYLVSYPDDPSTSVRIIASLATVVIFFLLHAWGVKEQ